MEVIKSVLCISMTFVSLYIAVTLIEYLMSGKTFMVEKHKDNRFVIWVDIPASVKATIKHGVNEHWDVAKAVIVLFILLLVILAVLALLGAIYYLIQWLLPLFPV